MSDLKKFYEKHSIQAPKNLLSREEFLYDELSKELDLFVKYAGDVHQIYEQLEIQKREFNLSKKWYSFACFGMYGCFFLTFILLVASTFWSAHDGREAQIKMQQREITRLQNTNAINAENTLLRAENARLQAEITKRDSKTCWGILK